MSFIKTLMQYNFPLEMKVKDHLVFPTYIVQ